MKKLLSALILVLCLCFFLAPTTSVWAQENQEEQGFDLREGYLAEIIFGNFNMKYGNIVYSLSITFDKSYYDQLPEQGPLNRQSLMDFISMYMAASRFTPEIDDAGRIVGKIEYDSPTDKFIKDGRDGYETNDDQDYEEKPTFFFTTITFTQPTVFSEINSPNGFLNMLKVALNTYGIMDSQILLEYHYGTPYKIITTDAEKTYFDTNFNIYVHEFSMTVDQSGREIVFEQTVPNSKNWYLLAIVFAVPVIIATLAGYLIHKIKETKGRI